MGEMAEEVNQILMEGAVGALRRRGVAAVPAAGEAGLGGAAWVSDAPAAVPFDGDVEKAREWLMRALLTLPGKSAYRMAPAGRRDGGRQAGLLEPCLPCWRVRLELGAPYVVVGPGPWYGVWKLARDRTVRDGRGDRVVAVELLCWELDARSAEALFADTLAEGQAVYVRGMWGLNDEPMEGSDVVASAWGERDWDELVARADKMTTDQLLSAG